MSPPSFAAVLPRHPVALGGVLAIVMLASLAPAHAQELRIYHFDVEQGDATLVISPDGRTLLFDAGNEGRGRDRVAARMRALGLTQLDYTVLSHYDADHVGGLDEVIAAGFVPTIAYDRGETSRGTLAAAEYQAAAGTRRRTIEPGEIIALGAEVTLECVGVNGVSAEGPSANAAPDEENERSVAFVLHYRDFDYFVAGDLTAGGLGTKDVESLIAPIVRDVDVLRVSHHGSPTSTGQALLDRLLPEVAIVSVGFANVYGHPATSVLTRLAAAPGLRDVWLTNRGTMAAMPEQVRVVGESSLMDGEIVLRTTGVASFSVNDMSYPIVADRVAPSFLSSPTVTDRRGDRVTLTVAASEPVELLVDYGFTTMGGSIVSRRTLSSAHTVTLTGLFPEATYWFRVGLTDASGNGITWTKPTTFTTGVAAGGLVINEVASFGSGADEWVELFNTSSTAIDVGGYLLTDNDGKGFVLPSLLLPPRGSIVVTSGTLIDDLDVSDARVTFHAGVPSRFGTTSVWNNDGDDVELRDPRGVTVDWVAYGTGSGIDMTPPGHFGAPPFPARPTVVGQSIARFPNGTDFNVASDWARPGPSTRGSSNGGEPPPPPTPPSASAGESLFGTEGTAVRLDGTASRPGSAPIVSYTWSFGDGTTATGATIDHTFVDDGSYVVTLTVRDANGFESLDAVTVEIANVAPTVSPLAPRQVIVGDALVVEAVGEDASVIDEAELLYGWDFGDGSALIDGSVASHVYAQPGLYTLTLMVEDKDGATAVTTTTVSVVGFSLVPLGIVGARDAGTGLEQDASGSIPAELRDVADGGAATVSGGVARFMEARFQAVGPLQAVRRAEVVVAHRMLSSRWAGTLRLELYAGASLLGSITLPKATAVTTTRWDVSALVSPTTAEKLTLRMVNDVPGTARVSWAQASVTLEAY
jgi:beta-lactamase superfamily II metal-dependent hydrolase/PKD repeat protein